MAKKFVRISLVALALCALLALSAFAYGVDLKGRVTGLEEGTDYTVAKYDFATDAYGEFAQLTTSTELTSGVWGVKAGDAEPETLFVSTTDSGYVNWYSNETGMFNSASFGGKVDGYVPGKWTVNTNSIYRNVGSYQNTEIILWVLKNKFQNQSQTQKTVTIEKVNYPVFTIGEAEYYLKEEAYYAVADNALYEGEEAPVVVMVDTWVNATPIIGEGNLLQESVVSYGFTNEQVVPANKVKEFKVEGMTTQAGAMIFNTKADGSKYAKTDIKGTFTWVVKTPGNAEETRYSIDIDANTKVFTAPAAMAESDGYVVAMEFAPYVNCPDDIFVGHPSDGNAECYAYINPFEGRNAVDFEQELQPAPVVYDGIGTIGYDSEFDIEIAPVTINADGTGLEYTDWTAYEYDITAERNMVGLYAVRAKYGANVTDVTFAYAYGDKAARADLGHIDEATGRVAIKGGAVGFLPGFWANTKWVSGSSINTHSTFGKWYLGTTGGQVTGTTTKNLLNAFAALAELKAAETPDEEAIAAAEATLLAAQTVVAGQYSSANYTYAYEADEIINVNELNTYSYSWYQNNANVRFTTARVKLIAYVADREGNVTPYTSVKVHNYPSGGTISGTFKFADFLPEEGWVVAIQVYPCSDIAPEEVTEVKTTGNGRMLLEVDPSTKYAILDASVLPKSDEKPEGLYVDKGVVKGFDADRRYAWAPFNLAGYGEDDWTVLPADITEYTFDREGAVAIMYAGNGYTNSGSQPTYVVLGGSDDNIINLVTKNGDHTQTTVDNVKYYNYSIDGATYYLKDGKYYLASDNTEYTGENAASATPIYKSTKDVPEVVSLENNDENTYNVKFNEGKWSGLVLSNALALNHGFDALCLGTTNTPIGGGLAKAITTAEAGTDSEALATARANAAKKSNAIYYSYAFKPEEIIKMSDFVSMDFRAAKRQGGLKLVGSAQTKIVFKVIDENGDLADRVVYKAATYDASGKKATVYGKDFADVSGYIVGIVFYPYVLTEGSYYSASGTANGDYNIYLYKDGYIVNRTLDPADRPENIVFDGNKITGLDADETYNYGLYTINGKLGDWTTVTGVTEITHELTGLIGLTIEGDGVWTSESEPVVGYVKGDLTKLADIGNVTDGKPAYKTSEYWEVGTWTGDYLSWHDQVTGGYAFLDQTTGVNCSMVETLWLYSVTQEEAQARLDADAAKGDWPNSNTTSNPDRLQAVIDAHYAAPDYEENLEANMLAHQTMIANNVAKRNIAYAFDETEIIPVDELVSMTFTSKKRQGGFKFGSVRSKVVVHVMDENAEVTAYEWWSDEWALEATHVWKDIKPDFQHMENLPDEGWVVGLEFYPYADVEPSSIIGYPDGARVDANGIAYSFGQQHVCIGYYPSSYTIYVEAPEVSFDSSTGIVSGLNANVTYQYAPYSINGAGTAITVDAGAASIQLTDGLWGITQVVGGVVSSPTIIYYRADNSTTMEIGTIKQYDGYQAYDYNGNDIWDEGKWSGRTIGVGTAFGNIYSLGCYGGHVRSDASKALRNAIADGNVTAELKARDEIVALANQVNFKYAYAADDIVPARDLLKIGFKASRRMGSLDLGDATVKVTFYVMDDNGYVSEYVWASDRYTVAAGGTFIVNTSDIEKWPTEGYVVAFEVCPWSDVDADAIKVMGTTDYNTMANFQFIPTEYSVVTGNEVAQTPVLELKSNNAIVITNYNNTLTYAYSTNGGETWTELTGNTIVATMASTEYLIKSLERYPYEESEVAAVTSRPVAVVGASLILDGRIGTRVYLAVDETLVDPKTLLLHSTKVNTDYAGVTDMSSVNREYGNTNLKQDWLTGPGYDEAKGLYYFTVYVPAKDADNISFETQLDYTLIGAENKFTHGSVGFNLKVTSYIETAKALAAAGDEAFVAALDLVEALETYVSYADNYFNKGEDAAYVSTASTDAIENATRTNGDLTGVAFYGTSLLLEDQVTIRHYFTVEDLAAFEAAYNVAGKYGTKGNYIYFDVADIPAQELGTAQTFSIADMEGEVVYEVNYSAANYIKSMMNSDDVNLVSLVNAMYDYYLAAADYAK